MRKTTKLRKPTKLRKTQIGGYEVFTQEEIEIHELIQKRLKELEELNKELEELNKKLEEQNVETSDQSIKDHLKQQINEKKIEKQQIIREIGPLQENQRKMYMKQRRPNATTAGGSQKKQKRTRNTRNKSNKK